MLKTLRVVPLAVALLGPCGPPPAPAEPPSPPPSRCHALAPAAVQRAEDWGYRVDCNSTAPLGDPRLFEWVNHDERTVTLNTTGKTDQQVRAMTEHAAGHIWRTVVTGRSNDQAEEERQASIYAWCHLTPSERDGLGWPRTLPSDCSGYRP